MSVSGAIKGATTGATIGAAFTPVGALIGAGVGAIGGAIATKKSPLEKQQAAMLKTDLERMKNGDLGLNAAQKQQVISQDTEAAGRNIAAQQMQMGQLAAANPFAAANINKASRAGSAQLAQTGAQSSQNADRISAQIADQEAARIREDLAAANKAKAKERAETVEAIGGMADQSSAALDVLKSSSLFDKVEGVEAAAGDAPAATAEPAAPPVQDVASGGRMEWDSPDVAAASDADAAAKAERYRLWREQGGLPPAE